ncbi:hypothetical protein [Paraliomyxa miuraensis]|uniref:hypothetical protein n=1 Tax=Paraliomyxa miuraensis TaxID=376150 RepID=UPI002254E07B|nr:hypothetical protein [Paraliomyxa miuraensis]MCX4240326.1 hypothetical protein [Paraliomyxa miuraensis]
MHDRLLVSFLLGFSLTALAGCPADDAPADPTDSSDTGNPGTTTNTTLDESGPTTEGPTTAGTVMPTTSVDTTADTGPDPSTSDTNTTDDTTDTAGACQVWEITYDLEGSEFEISGTPFMAGDQVNVLTMPYDADDTVGPGTFVLRFQDMGGEPGGMAAMAAYQASLHFVVNSGVTTVSTDLETDAGPEECGVTTGMLAGDTVAWMPSAIVGHHSMGQILCEGALCGAGGLPNGKPVPVDEVSDQPVSDFVFSGDLSSFTMEQTVIQMDANSTTSWMYMGTETGRELIDAPPCLCP